MSLNRNRLAVLPDSINDLSTLVELGLESNDLTEVPADLSGLKSLRVLSLADDAIVSDISALVAFLRDRDADPGMLVDLARMGCPVVEPDDLKTWLSTIYPDWAAGCTG